MCLDDNKWDISFVMRSINLTHDEILLFLGAQGNQPLNAFRLVHWSPPSQDTIKINVDGSCLLDSYSMGVGGVVRNSSKTCLGDFFGFVGIGDAFEAELRAVLEGLHFALGKGWRNIVIESDAQDVIHIFQGKTSLGFYNHFELIKEVFNLLQREWVVQLQHIHCDANKPAYCLAWKGSHSLVQVQWWEDPPPDVATFLLSDSLVSV
ncbi:Ribonuclease H domain [Sesbania bispinosa]|nr:Ribonuclease H domain [Sesbania bispinosa]